MKPSEIAHLEQSMGYKIKPTFLFGKMYVWIEDLERNVVLERVEEEDD